MWSKTSPRRWLVVCKESLCIGVILVFNLTLPWALISECQAHPRTTEASLYLHHLSFSLLLYPPSSCRWRSRIAWGQLQALSWEVSASQLLPSPASPFGISKARATLARGGEVNPLWQYLPPPSSHPHTLIFSTGKEVNVYQMPPMFQSLL